MSLQVFDQFLNTARSEVLAQNVNAFNAASNGAIILSAGANQGDFNVQAYYSNIANLIRRRNQYGSGAVSAEDITQALESSVKVAAGTPPINHPVSWWTWMQKNPEEAGAVLGQQVGIAQTRDMLNAAIAAFVAAIANRGAGVTHDGTAATATLSALNKGTALFGDRGSALACWVMHSKVYYDLLDKGLTNAERLFQFENVAIMQDASGKPFIVTDSPSLITAGAPDTYHTAGIVGGGVVVEANNDFFQNTETKNGTENIQRTTQMEWTFNLYLKGYEWDRTNGGKSPTDAALGTGTNWDVSVDSDKDAAGVLVNTQ